MPDILYKYLPPSRVDVLEHGRIRFSPVAELNDPFESRPRVRPNRGYVEHRARAEGRSEEDVQRVVARFTAFVEKGGTDTLWQAINAEFGILSLSADPLHPVMWGQYADSYRGYVLGLDAHHPWLAPEPDDDDLTSRPRSVIYQLQRPVVEIGGISNEAEAEAFRAGTILTKHEAWAFEKEYRIAKDARVAIPTVEAAGVTNLFPLPNDVVLEIIVGSQMSTDDEAAIGELLAQGRYPNAGLKKLVMDDDSYELRFEDVGPSPTTENSA